MASTKDFQEITLHVRSEEEAHQLVAMAFNRDEDNRAEQIKPTLGQRFWSLIGLLFVVLWKLLRFVVLTPFFLLTIIRNIFVLAIGLTAMYTLLSFAYYSFFTTLITSEEMQAATFVEWKMYILMGVIGFVAVTAAIYDYKEKFAYIANT